MSVITDKIVDKISGLTTPTNAAILGAVVGVSNMIKPTPPASKPNSAPPVKYPPLNRYPALDGDPFKVTNFIQSLHKLDGLAKNFQFLVIFDLLPFEINRDGLAQTLTLMTDKVVLPGWRTKTQTGRIYGLTYEIVTGLEQDPVWLSFKVDSGHDIEHFIMSRVKNAALASKAPNFSSFSPRYKDTYGFSLKIAVLDGRGQTRYTYSLENCFFKTVQNVPYTQGSKEFVELTCEIIYERVFVESHLVAETVPPAGIPKPKTEEETKRDYITSKNRVEIGPFTADISVVNQVKDTVAKIPDWLKGTRITDL